MPVLKEIRNTLTVKLPSFKEGKVTLHKGFLFSDLKEIEASKTDYERGVKSLIALAKEWNLTNEKGEVLPINAENLGKLPMKDMIFLTTKVNEILSVSEKKSKKPSS